MVMRPDQIAEAKLHAGWITQEASIPFLNSKDVELSSGPVIGRHFAAQDLHYALNLIHGGAAIPYRSRTIQDSSPTTEDTAVFSLKRKHLTSANTILLIPWFEFRFGETKNEGVMTSKMEIRGCYRSSADHRQMTLTDVAFTPHVREGKVRIFPWIRRGTKVYYAPAAIGVPDLAWDAHPTTADGITGDSAKRDVITGFSANTNEFTYASLLGDGGAKRVEHGTDMGNYDEPNSIPSAEDVAVFAVLGAEGKLSMSIPGVDSADYLEMRRRLLSGMST